MLATINTDPMTKECMTELSKMPKEVLDKVSEKLNELGYMAYDRSTQEGDAFILLSSIVIGMMED